MEKVHRFFFVVTVAVLLFSCFLPEGHADGIGEKAETLFFKLTHWPTTVWTEWWTTVQALENLGRVRLYEYAYYNENLAFISEGQSYWGAPFTHLLIDPNALDKREWDYRVEATTDRFIAIARRKTGRYQDREIRLDNKGALSGNYLFWLSKIPSRGGKGVMKIYYENGALHREVFWENGEPVRWKEYGPSGSLISEKP